MPRGRHRHSPPLHRLLPPSAIAGVSFVCALGPWVFTEPAVLRGLAAAAAATAVVGAVVMRRWDTQAGKRVAELTRARASDEWRFEERVAELEADLEESRELRGKLEQRLRAKRAELTGLRNEHAALLRRYATAETERASVLEARRVLEIEAAVPARALPAGSAGASAEPAAADGASVPEAGPVAGTGDSGTEAGTAPEAGGEQPDAAWSVFSPEGSRLFLRARSALARFDVGGPGSGGDGAAAQDAAEKHAAVEDAAVKDAAVKDDTVRSGAPRGDGPEGGGPEGGIPDGAAPQDEAAGAPAARESVVAAPREREGEREDAPRERSGAADGHEQAGAATGSAPDAPGQPGGPVQRPAGHFTVPTAVAVVPPAAPVRRPVTEGGFDFFGTKKGTERAALEAVQNEDLADVVGQEALALHKAETEARFKPADEESRAVGQVIDLTAHDETERIDVQGLRSAAS
ncbi:hypothetical protein ACIF8T_29690 [Streptomyces sp. NPDC085946]|uniref:hypothetical protein n=1 Tax=Streptomyces sp. NPDC085946 TaxID=3365744 RepID=UPI0037D55F81